MARSLNRVEIIGNLTADPEIRSFPSGGKVANFSVATSEEWKDRNTGERREKVEYHRCAVTADGLAGVVENWLRKGSKVFLEGRLETRKWQDQSGADRYTTEIVVRPFAGQLILLGDPRGGRDPSAGGGATAATPHAPLDDDIPF